MVASVRGGQTSVLGAPGVGGRRTEGVGYECARVSDCWPWGGGQESAGRVEMETKSEGMVLHDLHAALGRDRAVASATRSLASDALKQLQRLQNAYLGARRPRCVGQPPVDNFVNFSGRLTPCSTFSRLPAPSRTLACATRARPPPYLSPSPCPHPPSLRLSNGRA